MQQRRIGPVLAAGLVFGVFSGAALAQSAAEPDLISFGVGWFDILDDEGSVDVRIEYRPAVTYFNFIKPWAGIEVTSDGALYGAAGVLADFNLTSNIVLTPSFGAGLFSDGDGANLGHTVQFRSQLELGYRFENGSRAGIAFSHLSNANLGTRNPGAEVATVYYHLPVGSLFGD